MNDNEQDDELVMGLLERALARPQDERELYLRDACGGDSDLFNLVWHYVESEQRMKGFLMEPLLGSQRAHRFSPSQLLAGRFRVVREIAQGGMGVVYEALDEKLGQRIAIKCAKTGYSMRLGPEARSARAISHPNVCRIFEIHTESTEDGDIDFLAMEFLDGETLANRIRRGPLPEAEMQTIARQLSSGLAEAHRNGVIHGDLKSNNVILTSGPEQSLRAVITDFGLARMAATAQRTAQSGPRGGTPDYMAPELKLGERASPASDVYALGVILYELVSGRRPFSLITEITPGEHIGYSARPVHPKWDPILARCLDPRPERRFRDANELRRAIGVQWRERQQNLGDLTSDKNVRPNLDAPTDTSDLHVDESGIPTVTFQPAVTRSPELRQITVLFCEIGNSVKLQREPELKGLESLGEFERRCNDILRTYEGQIAQRLDTELSVQFGYPRSHENDAVRAVTVGLQMVDAARHLQKEVVDSDSRVSASFGPVRIGIHTGPVVVGDSNSSLHEIAGTTGALAARIPRVTPANTLVITEQTYELVRGFFDIRDLGEACIPGVAKPVRLFEVINKTSAEDRIEAAVALTALVSREREIGILSDCWEQAKQGYGQVILLSGDAGVGKSRLVLAFKERLSGQRPMTLECRCSPYHSNSPLHPILDLLAKIFRFTAAESTKEKLEKLREALFQYQLTSHEILSSLANLFALPVTDNVPLSRLSPERQRELTLTSIVSLLRCMAQKSAVLFVVEDLHWADPTTQDLLGLIVDQGPNASMLTVLTLRPEFENPLRRRGNVRQLTINPLNRRESEELVNNVTGGKALPREVLAQIIDHSDCLPLFIEELTKTVLTAGVLRETSTAYELTGSTASLAIPTTLKDSLMARLDRLGTAKEVAQVASVLGRSFSYEWLVAISPVPEDLLRDGLSRLVSAELLYRWGMPPEAQYTFKHALIKDAAYSSLLTRTKQQCHERIAIAIEQRFRYLADSQPELLAHHFTNAKLHAQAVSYWQYAGERARDRHASLEAAAHFGKALELLKLLPDNLERRQAELNLWTSLGAIELATNGYGSESVGKAFAHARELSEQVGESRKLFDALQGLWAFHVVRAEIRKSLELAERLKTIATGLTDSVLFSEASLRRGISLSLIGDLMSARDSFEEVIAGSDRTEKEARTLLYGQDRVVACLCHYSVVLWLLGYPDRALDASRKGIDLATELGHPFTLSWAYFYAALVRSLRSEPSEVLRYSELLRSLCENQGFAYRLAQSRILSGWALAHEKGGGQGINEIQSGIKMAISTGAEIFRPYYATLLADAHLEAGQPERSLQVVSEALELVRYTGERVFEPELYRIEGEIYAKSGEWLHDKAALSLAKSMESARSQHAKSFELRSAVSLIQLRPADVEVLGRLRLLLDEFGDECDSPEIRIARTLPAQASS